MFGLRLGRAVLALRRIGKAPHQIADKVGEFLEFAAAAAFRYPGEARHPLRHIGLKADAALLAVIADVDAGLHLLLHDMADGLVHFVGQQFWVEALALLLRDQKVAQDLVARQAADMGGENAVAAQNHRAGSLMADCSGHPRLCAACYSAIRTAGMTVPITGIIAAEFPRRHNALWWA